MEEFLRSLISNTSEPEGVNTSVDLSGWSPNDTSSDPTDLSRNDTEGQVHLYQIPTEGIVLLSIFYGTISLVAFVGNALVLWIVLVSRRMQNVTNYYIANLAFADVFLAVFGIPLKFQAAVLQRWNLPEFMCPLAPFIQCVCVNVSIFTLAAIAIDRYQAIIYPLRHKPTRMQAKLFILLIWSLGTAMSIPWVVVYGVEQVQDSNGGMKPFCTYVRVPEYYFQIYVGWILVTVQYFLPLTIICFAYIRMGAQLWGSTTPGNAQDLRDATLLKNKKRVIKMLVMVVAMFAFCWLPFQMYNVLSGIYPAINEYRYINIIWLFTHWLAMSNSCCNPFIYAIYNEKFQREFRMRCRCLCCGQDPSVRDYSVEFGDRIRLHASFRRNGQHSATGLQANRSNHVVGGGYQTSAFLRRDEGVRNHGDAIQMVRMGHTPNHHRCQHDGNSAGRSRPNSQTGSDNGGHHRYTRG